MTSGYLKVITKGKKTSNYHILYKLRSVTSYSLDSLEYINFSMLDHLFDARISCTIHTSSTSSITSTRREHN